jgi:hypothetical protein
MGSTMRSCLLFVSITTAFLAACGDLKSAGESNADASSPGAPDSSTGDSSTIPTEGGTPDGGDSGALTGPGPHGSLPSGYCCTADTECRYRHCVDAGGGGKMCLDECSNGAFCTRPDITFTCPGSGPAPGLCQPSAGFTCLDPKTFTRGSKGPGACCNAGPGGTNDGTAGSDCEGNQCASTDANPLVCTHRCAFQSDCPGGFECTKFGSSKACVPTAAVYTCE